MSDHTHPASGTNVLVGRYATVFSAAWKTRHQLTSKPRTPLERQFLPAALEIIDTPAPALPRAIIFTIASAFVVALLWSIIGHVDMVAVAPGKIISADRAKVIQPAETAVVKRLLVRDGQAVKAGDVLVELEAAATATAAETTRIKDGLNAARLEAARHDALANAAQGTQTAAKLTPSPRSRGEGGGRGEGFEPHAARSPSGMPLQGHARSAGEGRQAAEERTMHSQYAEHRAKLASLDAEIKKRQAELQSAVELANKLTQTAPIAKRRAEDYKDLVDKNFMSQHGYLEKEQVRIEQERDLAYQEAKVKELAAGIEEARTRRHSLTAEFERIAVGSKTDADKRAAQLEQELIKAQTRENQQVLTAPVDGTVQQLAFHTIGGVVTPAQALMVIAPNDYQAEVEAMLENKDVGFVKAGQPVEVKIETFPFTRYGTLTGTVTFVSNDAVNDEKKGLVFQARVKLDQSVIKVDERLVNLTPGMAVSAEIATGKRKVISYFLDPLRKAANESLRER